MNKKRRAKGIRQRGYWLNLFEGDVFPDSGMVTYVPRSRKLPPIHYDLVPPSAAKQSRYPAWFFPSDIRKCLKRKLTNEEVAVLKLLGKIPND